MTSNFRDVYEPVPFGSLDHNPCLIMAGCRSRFQNWLETHSNHQHVWICICWTSWPFLVCLFFFVSLLLISLTCSVDFCTRHSTILKISCLLRNILCFMPVVWKKKNLGYFDLLGFWFLKMFFVLKEKENKENIENTFENKNVFSIFLVFQN